MPQAPPIDNPIARELAEAVEGRYGLERELGRGGMGAVFLARDLKLDRLVAIKVLPPELAVRPELRERFLRETRTAASFSHPNIVPVHAVEESPSLLYFVMGYVEGETLSQRVRRQGPLAVADAVRLVQEVAWALSYAHGRGVVHRDVKPDNILLERATGRALVMDFGIARSAAASGLTQMGETVGTPHFMSPEQAAGDKLDGRSDLYALGLVAYFAVTGRLAFDAPTAQQVVVMQISQPAQPVGTMRPDLPATLTAAIDRCLAKEPGQRFASGEALVEALDVLRSRQVEVAPAIRMWTGRADQFFRNGLMLALLLPQLGRKFEGDVDQLVFTSIFTVAVVALWAQIPLGMRELVRQGFGLADLRSGIAAIDTERAAAQAAVAADPQYRRRRRDKWLILAAVGLVSAILIVLAMRSRVPLGPNRYGMRRPWVIALFTGVCLGMGTVVFSAATLAAGGRMERRQHRLWTGSFGGLLFRLAGWRLRSDRTLAAATPSRHGPLTLLESLPGGVKRRLGGARVTLERLEGEVERLERRERELESAVADAKAGAPSPSGGTSDGQQALLHDLDQARRGTVERRVAILGALESVRLSLVRLKTGIGTAADVDRALGEAAPLLESRAP